MKLYMDKCNKTNCYFNVVGQCKYFEWDEFYKWREEERFVDREEPACGNPQEYLNSKSSIGYWAF